MVEVNGGVDMDVRGTVVEENGGVDMEVHGESGGGEWRCGYGGTWGEWWRRMEVWIWRYMGRVVEENGGVDMEVRGDSGGGEWRCGYGRTW